MSLEIGSIVTVIDEELLLYNKQGEVVEIKTDGHEHGPCCVQFGKDCDYLFGAFPPKARIVRFSEAELRKDDRWELSTWATKLFGSMWHSAHSLPNPWSAENECMHKDHSQEPITATVRILVNCWGSVYEFDVCDEHKSLHGKCGEMLPIRQAKAAA